MKKHFPLLGGLLMCVTSCSESGESPCTIAFKDKVSFDSFPLQSVCKDGGNVDFNTIGNREIIVVDSVAVVATSVPVKPWKVVSLSSDSVLGELLDTGNGPGELVVVPMLSQASVIEFDGSRRLSVPDVMTHTRHNFDLGKVIAGCEVADSIVTDEGLNNFTIYQGVFADGLVYKLSVDPAVGRVNRSVTHGGQTVDSKAIERLNGYSVDSPEKLGLLIPTVAVAPSGKRVVEIYNSYPQINLYSLTDDWATTIAPGGQTADYEEYMGKSAEMPAVIYRGVRGYDSFFVVNKVGEGESSELQFFDWDGKPLLSLTIPTVVTSFDIDFGRKRLMTVNFNDDVIGSYDLSRELPRLGSK